MEQLTLICLHQQEQDIHSKVGMLNSIQTHSILVEIICIPTRLVFIFLLTLQIGLEWDKVYPTVLQDLSHVQKVADGILNLIALANIFNILLIMQELDIRA